MTGRKYQLARWALAALCVGFLISAGLVVGGFAPLLTGGEFVTGLGLILASYGASNVAAAKFSGGTQTLGGSDFPPTPSKAEPQ